MNNENKITITKEELEILKNSITNIMEMLITNNNLQDAIKKKLDSNEEKIIDLKNKSERISDRINKNIKNTI